MPRDWKNDPTVIRRHCKCGWTPREERTTGEPVDLNGDGRMWWRPFNRPDCPLHGDDPAHDLPDGVL